MKEVIKQIKYESKSLFGFGVVFFADEMGILSSQFTLTKFKIQILKFPFENEIICH